MSKDSTIVLICQRLTQRQAMGQYDGSVKYIQGGKLFFSGAMPRNPHRTMAMIETYQQALDYIYGFIDPTRPAATGDAAARRNLGRMRALLAAAGDPHAAMQTVVVAGTKGKGSTCIMIEAIARAAGLRTGLFTSPHLNSYRERMQVEREQIEPAALVELINRLKPAIDGFDPAPNGPPTAFDVGLLLGLCYFAERGVQIAVMEIGMGGRFDTVNALTPLVSAISSISLDHTAILGSTLGEIAWNKAGIMKPGVPAVAVPQLAEAATALLHEAETVGCPLWRADEHELVDWRGVAPPRPYPVAPLPGLRGGFQQENARLATGVAMLLREQGLNLPDAAIATGLAETRWPGRFELVPGSPPLLLDGAHNGDSAEKLAAALAAELRYERLVLVLGTSRDKDIGAIAAALVPQAAALVLTRSGHPRAMDIDRMLAAVEPYTRGPVTLAPDVAAGIAAARGLAGPRDLICVTGSLFVAAAAREALGLAVSD